MPDTSQRPAGAPNVVVILLDDLGFAQFGCYGSDIATPNVDRLARDGLRYSRFHVTALCSPTRASLLTGRNHHAVGMGFLADIPTTEPGYTARIPASAATLAPGPARRRLQHPRGRQVAPASSRRTKQCRSVRPLAARSRLRALLRIPARRREPLGARTGTRQLVRRNTRSPLPRAITSPKTSLTRRSGWSSTSNSRPPASRSSCISRPAPCMPRTTSSSRGRMPTAAGSTSAGTGGVRRSSTARWPRAWCLPARPSPSGRRGCRRGTDCARTSGGCTPGCTRCTPVSSRHTDAQIGRLIASLSSNSDVLDNTVFFVMSDNGASAEGGVHGTVNEHRFTHQVADDLSENLDQLDDWGGIHGYPHYAWGWAWAGNTPFRLWKRYTWLGGTRVPMIVHWPQGIDGCGSAHPIRPCHRHLSDGAGRLRHQRHRETVDGVAQQRSTAPACCRRSTMRKRPTRAPANTSRCSGHARS